MEDEFNEGDAEYMSKLPKSMLLAIIARLMKLLGEVHIVCLEDENPSESLEIVKEKYVNPDNLTILLVTRIILNKLAHLPYEAAMIEMEREDFFQFWKESLNDTQEFVANAELDILLHELGIDRPTEED